MVAKVQCQIYRGQYVVSTGRHLTMTEINIDKMSTSIATELA